MQPFITCTSYFQNSFKNVGVMMGSPARVALVPLGLLLSGVRVLLHVHGLQYGGDGTVLFSLGKAVSWSRS